MSRWLCWALLSTALVACAAGPGEAFERSFNEAKRAYSAGRYEEAARLYEGAAGNATRIKDRDEAFFMQARMFEKLRRWQEARKTYAKLAAVSPAGPRTARAIYEQAEIEIEHGDADSGWAALSKALLAHPSHGSARRALTRWCQHTAETRGEGALRVELGQWKPRLAGTDIAQQLSYEVAWSLRRSGNLREAHALFLRTAGDHPYPFGTLTDDALWHASEIAVELGDCRLAVADLRQLLAPREVAQGGSYERPRFPQAQLRIAELFRDCIGDLPQARRELRRMVEQHESSVLADDALWAEGVLVWRQGKAEEACSLARELPKRFPGSRYRPCLRELCPGAEPPARPCPRYILDDMEGRQRLQQGPLDGAPLDGDPLDGDPLNGGAEEGMGRPAPEPSASDPGVGIDPG